MVSEEKGGVYMAFHEPRSDIILASTRMIVSATP